jgi:glycosyltransferase involved in cell wall biosynthesis
VLEGRRVVLVHDWLNGMRGGEKCLEVLCELFPEAPIYTLIHEEGRLSATIEAHRIVPSFIQHLPHGISHYRYFLPLFPTAIEQFRFDAYDLIISTSHCVAKGAKPGPETYHFSYVHAPMRYVWDLFDTYFRRTQTHPGVRIAAELVRPYLKNWDRRSTSRVHTLLCNSRNVRRKIREYYSREAQVIHPPVDVEQFQPGSRKSDCYLIISAFAPNKRIDLAVEAFNRLKLPLKIVGSGQDEAYCRSIAQDHIEFLGEQSSEALVALYQEARAFVFPGEDDFGITPLEAQASGTPVIAFGAGGALETVNERTGLFFHEQRIDALCAAIEEMERRYSEFDPDDLVRNAARFGRERYKQQMAHAIEYGYRQWKDGLAEPAVPESMQAPESSEVS